MSKMEKLLIHFMMAVTMVTMVGAVDVATFICDGKKIVITGITIDSFTPKAAFAKGKSDMCGTAATAVNANDANTTNNVMFTGAGTTADPYKATIADASGDNCGVVTTTSTAGTTRTVTIFVTKNDKALFKDDKFIVFTCVEGPITAEQTANVGTVNGEPDAEIVSTADIDIELKLVEDTKTAAISTASLGDSVQLMLILKQTDRSVKKCKMVTCVADGTATFGATSVKVITEGCTDDTDSVFANKNGQPTATAVAGAKTATVTSTAFGIMKFPSKNAVHFRCTCQGCLAGDVSCTTYLCPITGRKRRDVAGNNATRSAQAQSVVYILDRRNANTQGNQDHEVALSNCLNHVSFISVVAILAILLMISLVVSVFFCWKLIGQKRNVKQKECYPNHGYKA